MNTDHAPTATTYLGLFFVALATVMYEIVLTRIFSVTMWYHFAFVASSIARQQERFDIIQISLIDTWAATAAGAFARTENSL